MTDMLAEIAAEAVRATERYDEMSGQMGAWRTPESWLQCSIASMLRRRYYVMLEARTTELLDWYFKNTRNDRTDTAELEGKRIDIVLFSRTEKPEDAPIVGLIEIKKYGQRFVCDSDACRLRKLSEKIKSIDNALIVAHLEAGTELTLNRYVDHFQTDTKVSPNRMTKSIFLSHETHCASVVAELLDGKRE